MDASETALWAQEGSQPPLYYVLAALAMSWIDTSDAEDLYWSNPQRNLGNPGKPGNKNFIVHTEREQWPYQNAVLAVHAARWLSLLFGLGTVAMTFLLVYQSFPDRPQLALGAAGVNAFIPQFLFISSSVSNDSLIMFLSAWALYQLTRKFNRPDSSLGSTVLLGVTVGLAAITKLSGLALLGLTGFVLAWLAVRNRSWRPLVQGGLIVIALTAAIAGWWYLRNLGLYGDLSGLELHLDVMGGRRDIRDLTLGRLWAEFIGLRASFWGLFGWFNILMPSWVYGVLDLATVVGVIGLVDYLRRQGKRVDTASRSIFIALVWFAIVAASLIRWTTITKGSQGRLLFPAISGMALVLAVGWAHLSTMFAGERQRDGALVVAATGLMMLSVGSLIWVIPPAYAGPVELDVADLPSEVDVLELQFDQEILMYGCEADRDRVEPGEDLAVTCYWEALKPINKDYAFFHHVLGQDLKPIGKLDGYPSSGALPASLWPVGPVIAATEWVRIDRNAAAPVLGRVVVGIYDPETRRHLTPTTVEGNPLELVIAEEVKIAAPAGEKVSIPNQIHYSVGDLAILSGFEIGQMDSLTVTLYWQVAATPTLPQDYAVFVHLLDDTGTLRGQGDSQPLNGQYPTRVWEAGETIVDLHHIEMDADAPPGAYQVAVGLYRPIDHSRLPVADAKGALQPGDRIILPQSVEFRPE
jgi:4-amino-4-deoxy-L-arabinose transferase-like glycosyltransferase